MGYIRHDAIIVTGWDDKYTARAHDMAIALQLPTSVIVNSPINNYSSFLIAPDGSKEGWAESDKGDEARLRFIELLRSTDGLYVDWVHVSYGGDSRAASVTDHSDNLPVD